MNARLGALFLLLASPIACNDGEGGISTNYGDVPVRVVEGVRREHPATGTDDLAVDYRNIKTDVPSASDDAAVQWIIEVLDWNTQTEAWNDCLERHDGRDVGCTEPDDDAISDDSPLGW